MRQPFFEDLMTAMYPSGLLHTFGVNGKISGSVGAVGEMQEVLPLLHSPRGCGFHYRYSARRRHQPFYSVLTSNLEERDIICGGEEKLRQAIRDAWSRYRPGLIMVIPSPISDILNEDVRSVCAELRREGISVVGVQSELFSHRDKNYTRNRLKELAHQTITGDNRLEMELKGCGFTEALYALVEQVMEPSAQIPHSINIETVGWGSEGKAALRELEVFLNGCGIQVNTWIPSAPLSSLVHAPAAELLLPLEAHHAGMGAGGQEDTEAPQIAPAGAYGLYVTGELQPGDLGQQKFSAEALRLLPHGLGKLRPAGPAHAGIVHHFRGNGDLPAEPFLFHHKYTVSGARQVEGGRKACRAAPNDYDIIEFFHRPIPHSCPTKSRLGFKVSAPGCHLAGHTSSPCSWTNWQARSLRRSSSAFLPTFPAFTS